MGLTLKEQKNNKQEVVCGTLEALVVANRGRNFDGLGIEGAKTNKQKVVWGTLEALVVANSEREFFDGLGIEGAKKKTTGHTRLHAPIMTKARDKKLLQL